MKKGFIFLFLVLTLAFVNLAMTSSIKSDSSINVEKAVYEKLEKQDKVKVIVRLYDEPKQISGRKIATAQAIKKEEVVNSLSQTGNDNFNLIYKAESVNGFTAEISSSALEELKRNPSVKYVKVEPEIRLFLQDSAPMINATLVWPKQISSTNITGEGQTVCIIDTGINYTHLDLGGCLGMDCRVLGGYAFSNPFDNSNKTNVMDDNGHGTHVAGIAGANGSITGIAPGVKFVAVKACGPTSACSTLSIIDSVNWCVGNASRYNISVISMSLGTVTIYTTYCNDENTDMTDAIDSAIAKNITVVVATGNSGSTTGISWPACIRNATAVGSTTKADAVSSFSNMNNITTILALGGTLADSGICSPGSMDPNRICSTAIDGQYISYSGTSMATPMVSGAVALLKQYKKLEKNINLTTVQIKDILNRTGKRIFDSGSGLTLSRLNVYAALVDIDLTAPNISIFSPQNKTYATNTSLPLNFTITDNLNLTNCWYSLDSNTNVTLQNCGNSTFNSSLGNHTLYLYANDSIGNENSSYILFNVNFPLVNLLSPPNGTLNATNSTQTFSCNASDLSGLQNVTFYVWNSTGQVHTNTSNKSGETYNQTNFSYALPYEGIFKWNCKAYDNASNFSWASNGNYTITYDATSPNVTLISPENGTAYSENDNVTFIFNVSDSSDILNCSLIINSAVNKTNATPISINANQTVYSVLISSTILYNWSVNCTDAANNTGKSATWQLNLSAINLTSCNKINSRDEVYYVQNDLISNSNTCIDVEADNTTIDYRNHSMSGSTGYDLNISNLTVSLKNFVIERYSFLNISLSIENSSYARINFPNISQNGTNLSQDIVVRYNYIFVNSSKSGLNKSANLSLYNLNFNNPRIIRNDAACPASICTKTTYNSSNGTLIFNVTGFSTYYAEDYCGNGYCDNGEACSSCSADCGSCPATTSSGGGGGGGGGGIIIYSEGNLAEGREINKLAKKYDEIKFSLRGNEHILNVKSVQKENALFELNSTSLNFSLVIGESRKFNLTDENFYDFYINLNNITNSKANLSIRAILEEIPFAQQSETNIPNVTNGTKPEQNITSLEILPEEKKKEQERRLLESRRVRASLVLFILITIIIFAIIINRNHQTLKRKKSIVHSPKRILKRR